MEEEETIKGVNERIDSIKWGSNSRGFTWELKTHDTILTTATVDRLLFINEYCQNKANELMAQRMAAKAEVDEDGD